MDVLTDVIQTSGAKIRIDRCVAVDRSFSLVGDWGDQGAFYAANRGRVRVDCQPGASLVLNAGDVLFLFGGKSLLVLEPAETEPAEVVMGRVEFAVGQTGLGGVSWPPVLSLPATDDLSGLVSRLADEVRGTQSGWEAVANGLANVLLVAAIRAHRTPNSECAAHGWLRGLSDPEIGLALQLMHERPAHPWTVAELADRLSISRSAFAARFKQVTGRPPLTYLTWWRLCCAAARLRRRDGATVAQVARDVGYETEAAFGKAFRRQFGRTPAQVRREGGGAKLSSTLQVELKKRDPFDVREQEVAINLMRSAAKLQADFKPLIERHGLYGPAYNVLRILRGEGKALPWAEVSSRLIIPHALDEVVSSLHSLQLIECDAQKILKLTTRGGELLAALDVPVIDLHRRQLAHLSPGELAELNRLLVKARRPDH